MNVSNEQKVNRHITSKIDNTCSPLNRWQEIKPWFQELREAWKVVSGKTRCARWPRLVQCTRFDQPLSMWFLLLRWLMSHYFDPNLIIQLNTSLAPWDFVPYCAGLTNWSLGTKTLGTRVIWTQERNQEHWIKISDPKLEWPDTNRQTRSTTWELDNFAWYSIRVDLSDRNQKTRQSRKQ